MNWEQKPMMFWLGIVGRLTEIKNHELFLKGAAEFKSPMHLRRPCGL